MENNEQMTQETASIESPKTEPKKAKTTRKTAKKQTVEKKEPAKKPARKARSAKTEKSVQATENVQPAEPQQQNQEESAASAKAEAAKTADKEPAQAVEEQKAETVTESKTEEKAEQTNTAPQAENARHGNGRQEQKIPSLPAIRINNIVELMQAPLRSIVLTDQQIQQLTLEEIEKRHRFLEDTLANVLDYDVVLSDTNIWLELLVGYTSSHSDPKYNARLQFERQLEFVSKLVRYRGGRFIMMGETYEEIDRFASMQDPANHRDADFTDNIVCLNTAARLAKRLILAQQRENRLRIEGIGAESHHASFADPAIIRKVADLFAEGKKVLLLTNDASVAIRAMGICDDLQRHNNIPDDEWEEKYAPLRPMVFTFDDLKQLDFYTRQYHYIQMAAGAQWMEDIEPRINRDRPAPLTLWMDAFRPGDKHRGDNLFTEQEKLQVQQKQNKQKQQEQQKQQQEQKKKQGQQKQTQQKKQQDKPEIQKQEAVAAPNIDNPAHTTNAQKQENQPANATANDDKKPEQKQGSRSRRKPQRARKANTEKTVEPTEMTDNAQ